MKKTFKMMAVVAMGVTLALAGCGKDETNDNTGGGSDTETVAWVDLGLPSGLLWAECNLGAATSEEYGDYFAWGETSAKTNYLWSNYKHCHGTNDQLSKYCNNSNYGYNGYSDSLTTLQSADDAATECMGDGARIPTKEEWQELIDNTTAIWTTQNGINGCRFTAENGKTLFLPASGSRWENELDDAGECGRYWSASLLTPRPSGAWGFSFESEYQSVESGDRFIGRSVRPVRNGH